MIMKQKITLLFLFVFLSGFLFAQKGEQKNLAEKKGPKNQISVKDTKLMERDRPDAVWTKGVNPKGITHLSEGFEGSFPPSGWTNALTGAGWIQTTDPHEGSYSAKHEDEFGTQDDTLISPLIDLNGAVDPVLTFWQKNNYVPSYYVLHEVIISADGSNWTQLIELSTEAADWQEIEIDLSTYNDGSYYIGFHYEGDFASEWWIDDVVVSSAAQNDAGISDIITPSYDKNFIIEGDYNVKFEQTNYGVANLTEDSIAWGNLTLDLITGQPTDTAWGTPVKWTGDLATNDKDTIEVGTVSLTGGQAYGIGGWTYMPNGVPDEAPENDTLGNNYYVFKPGQLIETFEGGKVPPMNWDADPAGWDTETQYPVDGISASIWQNIENTERKDLYTPKLTLDGTINHLFFEIAGVNNEAGSGSSKLTVKYAETMEGPWTDLVTYDMATEGDDPHTKAVDLSSISEGDYYFAFSAVSDFDYVDMLTGQRYSSAVVIDNLAGPIKANVNNNDLAVVNLDYDPHDFMTVGNDTAEVIATIQNVGLLEQKGFDVTLSINGESVATKTVDSLAYNGMEEVVFEFSPEVAGEVITLQASTPDDDNTDNNSMSINVVGVDNSMNTYDFEFGLPSGWSANGWFSAISDVYSYDGTSLVVCDGDASAGPWEDYKLITEKYSTKGSFDKFYFYARRLHPDPSLDYQSTIELMYTNEIGGSWTKTGETIELTDEYKLYSVDVSSLPEGEYYFAFNASSGYIDSQGNIGNVLMDHVVTPPYPGPAVDNLNPLDDATNVAYDAEISVEFDQEIDSVDFSDISIMNSSDGAVTIDSVKITDSWTMQIFYDTLALQGEIYTVNVPENTVSNGAVGNDSIKWSFRTTMEAPQPELLYPDTMAQGIPLDGDVYIKFNQEITRSSGLVTMTSKLNGPVVGVTASVDVDNQTLLIAHNDFVTDDTITVNIGSDAVANEDGVENADTSWTFYTMEAGQPVADSLAPANNERTVALDANVEIHLSEAVTENDLSGITIVSEANDTVTGVTPTLSEDSIITISHDAFPENNELYTVTIPEGAVTSQSTSTNNAKIEWNFTTIMAAPMAVKMDPVDGATGVALDYSTLRLEFDQSIDDSQVNLDTVFTVIGESDDTVAINTASIYYANDKIIDIMLDENFPENGEMYTVTMKVNAVHNRDSVFNDAISWQFTTIKKAPKAVSYTPSDGATGVALDASVSVTFDQELTVNSLSGVTIESQKMGQVSGVSASLAADNMTINIAHDDFFTANNDVYTVTIPTNSVMNSDGIINETVTFTFSTLTTWDVEFEVNDGSNPLSGINVTLGSNSKTTDANGEALFAGITDGTSYNYTIESDGYQTITGYVVVDEHKTMTFTMQIVESIESLEEVGINVYPNPSNGRFHINNVEGYDNAEVTIVDMTGKVVYKGQLDNVNNTVHLQDQAEGVYILRLKLDDQMVNGKLMLK